MIEFIVSKDGNGDFDTISKAIDASKEYLNEEIRIFVKKGIYKEKLFIERDHISLIGEACDQTIITYDDYGYKLLSDTEKMGTFRSYTVFVGGNCFQAHKITFENSSGDGESVGQAVAVYVNGDEAIFDQCRFIGSQDTLFTGPLPETEKIPGGFKGPGEHLERKPTCQLYKNCYIVGDIDFIFGSATAVFYKCEIEANDRKKEINAYITAPSTPKGQDYGYVFMDCRLTSKAGKETVYLGRPWRDYGKVAFINCWMGDHIHREGWHNWDNKEAESTVEFVEYNSSGPGARLEDRVKWSRIIDDQEVGKYTLEKILPKSML